MISSNDCVTLSDDDDPEQVPAKRRRGEENGIICKSDIETIVIDEEVLYDNNNIPYTRNSAECLPIHKLEEIHKDDLLFSEFIEKCLDLENSDGMIQIVKNTILPAYESCSKDYKKSPEFRRVIIKALNHLETDPDHKFSKVRDVVETLRFHKQTEKKRVQLTTLATNLNKNGMRNNGFPIKSPIKCIILDSDDEQKDMHTIDLDEFPNEPIDLVEEATDEEKENYIQENGNMQNTPDNFLVPRVETSMEHSNSQGSFASFVAQEVLPIEYEPPAPDFTAEKIKLIEYHIGQCKERIRHYEEAEVLDDSMTSPYLICERYKTEVVRLYKQLCELTGQQPVKHRKVRLQVLEGHPPGPVRRLETFINDNIGQDGIPMFPDFCDVVKCVMVANIEEKLGWSKQLVMREANALFTQCGRALQKQRQRREYRHLLARLKAEPHEYDPADEDPELLRKLEKNRQIAVKKENDLLEKYVQLQYQPKPGPSIEKPNAQTPVVNEPSATDEQHQPSPISDVISDEDSNFEPPEVRLSQDVTEVNPEKTDLAKVDCNEETKVKVKKEPIDIVQLLEELGNNYTMSVIDIEDPHLVIEISSEDDDDDSSDEIHVDGESESD